MGENSRLAEFDKRVAERDSKYPTPAARALAVYKILRESHPELTTWDLTCFAVEWLGLMTPAWEWLKDAAKMVNKVVYEAHYFMPEENLITSPKIDKIGTPTIRDQ